MSFKLNWRKVSSKVFSFASYLLAMDWRTFLVVPLPEGCSSNSRYPRPSEEYLYGKLFMSVWTMVWATIITKEYSAKLLYNVFRHFCSKSNLRWQHLWILLHAEMINRKELTIRLKQKGLGLSLYFCQSNLLGEWTYIQQEQSKWELAKGGSPTLFEDERMSFRGCSFPR